MNNFFCQVLLCCLASVIFASEVQTDSPSHFDSFGEDILYYIGQYLLIPQKEMGFLNRACAHAFFVKYPLKKIMSGRFGIPELERVEREDDLVAFKYISLTTSDSFHLFQAIGCSLLSQNAFPYNAIIMSRHVFKAYTSLPADLVAALDPYLTDIVKFASLALSWNDFDILFKLFSVYPDRFGGFFESLMSDKAFSFIKSVVFHPKANELYPLFFNCLQDDTELSTFFLNISILVGSPENLYWTYLTGSRSVSKHVMYFFFMNNLEDEKITSKVNLFGLISRLLDYFENHPVNAHHDVFTPPQLELDRLFVKICYDTDASIDYQTDMGIRTFNADEFLGLSIAAFFGNRIELAHQILSDLRMAEFLTADKFLDIPLMFKPKLQVILNFFSLFSESEKTNFFTNRRFLTITASLYDAHSINENEDGIILIDFRAKSNIKRQSLPETFNFLYPSTETNNCFELPRILLGSIEEVEENALFSLISSLAECRILRNQDGLSDFEPVKITDKVAEMILKSESLHIFLRECGLKLKTDAETFAKLLSISDVEVLKGIFIIDNLKDVLVSVSSKIQFRNLEQYTNHNIANLIFKSDILKSTDCTPNHLFFRLRFALRYWLEGPEKQRLLEIAVPLKIRTLLANESYIEDAKFLLQQNQ